MSGPPLPLLVVHPQPRTQSSSTLTRLSTTTFTRQEDNLQHLALFSEYGRIALAGARKKPPAKRTPPSSREGTPQKQQQQPAKGGTPQKPGTPQPPSGTGTGGAYEESEGGEGEEEEDAMLLPEDEIPFQRIEFLVRDWMDFDEEVPFHKLKEEMDAYLQDVIEKGGAKDLRQTRDHILSCFQKVRACGRAFAVRCACLSGFIHFDSIKCSPTPPPTYDRCGASSCRTRAWRCPRGPTRARWSSCTPSSAASSTTTPATYLAPSSRQVR